MKLGITMLIHNKDDIEFVTEFPCFLGHPVSIYKRDLPCTYGNAQLIMVPIRIFNSDISVVKVSFKEKQQIKILIYNSYPI